MDSVPQILEHIQDYKELERFVKKVDIYGVDECWEWAGEKKHQYGRFYLNGTNYYAHRVAWVIFHGKAIPKGMCVCHTCDNPPCVNPSHLWIGTNQDNTKDMLAKGRSWAQKCSGQPPTSSYSLENIKKSYWKYGGVVKGQRLAKG